MGRFVLVAVAMGTSRVRSRHNVVGVVIVGTDAAAAVVEVKDTRTAGDMDSTKTVVPKPKE